MGPAGQSLLVQRPLIKDPKGEGGKRVQERLARVSSSPATPSPLPSNVHNHSILWPWRGKVTLKLPPYSAWPSRSHSGVAGRRPGGLEEGGKGCRGYRASTPDEGCHRNLWGGAPRREGGGARWEEGRKRRGLQGPQGRLRRSRRWGRRAGR